MSNAIKETCFGPFVDLHGKIIRQPIQLVKAIITKFERIGYTFSVGPGASKLIYSLEDVLYITGLPISGKPVTGTDYSSQSDASQVFVDCLGKAPSTLTGSRIQFRWLKDNFEKVPEEIDTEHQEFIFYVRAYILAIISSVMDCDKTKSLCNPKYLPLIVDVSSIDTYAWGAAMLAHLNDSLAKLANGGGTVLSGFTYSLIVSIV